MNSEVRLTLNTKLQQTEIKGNILKFFFADLRLGPNSSLQPFVFGKNLYCTTNSESPTREKFKQQVTFLGPIFKCEMFPTVPELHSDSVVNSGRNLELHNSPKTAWVKEQSTHLISLCPCSLAKQIGSSWKQASVQ